MCYVQIYFHDKFSMTTYILYISKLLVHEIIYFPTFPLANNCELFNKIFVSLYDCSMNCVMADGENKEESWDK